MTSLNGIARVIMLDDSCAVAGRKSAIARVIGHDASFSIRDPVKVRDISAFDNFADLFNSYTPHNQTGLSDKTWATHLTPRCLNTLNVGSDAADPTAYRDSQGTSSSVAKGTAATYNPLFGFAQLGGAVVIINYSTTDAVTVSINCHMKMAIVPQSNGTVANHSDAMAPLVPHMVQGQANSGMLGTMHSVSNPGHFQLPSLPVGSTASVCRVQPHPAERLEMRAGGGGKAVYEGRESPQNSALPPSRSAREDAPRQQESTFRTVVEDVESVASSVLKTARENPEIGEFASRAIDFVKGWFH